MDYHKNCWANHKESFIAAFKLTKVPTERDFFGKECFTPDCGGRIYRIEIHDQDGTCACLEDKSVEEEREKKKNEAKHRREVEHKTSKPKIPDIKKHKKVKAGVSKNSSPEEGPAGDNAAAENKENNPANHGGDEEAVEPELIDYSNIDVSNALVIKKNRGGDHIEEEENKRKKKATNKKTVISLGEFIGHNGVEVGI
jgi:hypothetical protein